MPLFALSIDGGISTEAGHSGSGSTPTGAALGLLDILGVDGVK